MIFNREVLFLHLPKTAGKSVAQSLVAALDRPLWCYVPPGTERSLRELDDLDGVTFVRSGGHEGMRSAFDTMRSVGIDPDGLRAILVVVRDPYELMVSNYHFMRSSYEGNEGRPNFEIARSSDFETYCRDMSFFAVERFFRVLDEPEPAALRVLRHEHLAADFASAMADLGVDAPPLPHLNRSEHPRADAVLTPGAEAAVAAKFQYLFDAGHYQRRG